MRISFCEDTVDNSSNWYTTDMDDVFQSSFMRISFCELTRFTVNVTVPMRVLFQSSFMRISFCEYRSSTLGANEKL